MPASIVDSGVYHYSLNGESTAVRERWQRRRHASGQWLVTSTRTAPGVEIAVEARVADGVVMSFEIGWLAQGKSELRWEYRLAPDRVLADCSAGDAPLRREEVAFPAGSKIALLSPLMRIFAGPLIARLLDNGGRGAVVLPYIADPTAQSRLLQPVLSDREARVLESDLELELPGGRFRCRRCEYLGDQYGPGSEFWLAEDELLVRYQWQQSPDQHWDVWLQRDG